MKLPHCWNPLTQAIVGVQTYFGRNRLDFAHELLPSRPREAKKGVWALIGRKAMAAVSMTVNGKAVSGDVEARTLLVQFLRENLRLTGTHVGCDTSQCGACVVHIDGIAAKSCTTLALQCEGAKVTTIEGLAEPNGPLHPMQEAFRE